MNTKPLDRRLCANGFNHDFRPTRSDRKFCSDTCKQAARRARKKQHDLELEKEFWYTKLSDVGRESYKVVINFVSEARQTFWDLYLLGGIAIVEKQLALTRAMVDVQARESGWLMDDQPYPSNPRITVENRKNTFDPGGAHEFEWG